MIYGAVMYDFLAYILMPAIIFDCSQTFDTQLFIYFYFKFIFYCIIYYNQYNQQQK